MPEIDAAQVQPSTAQQTMTVTIFTRVGKGWDERKKWHTITISCACPKCGGARGVPYWGNNCEDGEHFGSSMWVNPCGHVDHYFAVLLEAVGA